MVLKYGMSVLIVETVDGLVIVIRGVVCGGRWENSHERKRQVVEEWFAP